MKRGLAHAPELCQYQLCCSSGGTSMLLLSRMVLFHSRRSLPHEKAAPEEPLKERLRIACWFRMWL